ncbi:MAG: sulfatase [Planctomycetaceae bacterium]
MKLLNSPFRRVGLLAIALLFSSASLFRASAVRAAERPNILFIFADDHASHALSCYGSKINKTPNLDRIAKGGMLFRNCFCTNSICGPSRAVILTGKHSHLNGFLHNGNRFRADQQTFPKVIRKAGYQTAMIGKWHLKSSPADCGFDYHEVLVGQGPYYNPPMIRNRKRVKHIGYTTDIITDVALDWLKTKRDKSKPFVLMFQHKAPHRNWQPGPKYLRLYDDVTIPEPDNLFDDYSGRGRAAHEQDMTIKKTMTPFDLKLTAPRNLTQEQRAKWDAAYGPKNAAFRKAKLKGKALVRWKYQRYIKDYLRCIASVDENVGRMLDYLDASGLAKNTIVIYSSDQGFYLGDHGWFDKRFMYEESYRMPLMVRWPGVIKPGSVNTELVSNLDFAETFLDIAGAKVPGDMQGRSIVPLLRGTTPADWQKSLYYHYYEFFQNRRVAHMVRRHNGVRTKRYKLIHFYNLGEWELYDLKNDAREMKSVYNDPSYAGVVKELKAELKRLQQKYKVPDDTGSVSRDPPSLKLRPRNRKNRKKRGTKRRSP